MKKLAGTIASGILAMATFAVAHTGATGVTLERMKGMTSMRDVMRDIAPLMQGNKPFDALAVSEAGYLIASYAGSSMLDLFPEGSTSGVTYAKSTIWSEWQEFAALAEDLKSYGEALSIAAPVGLEKSSINPPEAMAENENPMSRPEDRRAEQISVLMGYAAGTPNVLPAATSPTSPEQPQSLANLGAGEIFAKISGTCSTCHARFRDGKG